MKQQVQATLPRNLCKQSDKCESASILETLTGKKYINEAWPGQGIVL